MSSRHIDHRLSDVPPACCVPLSHTYSIAHTKIYVVSGFPSQCFVAINQTSFRLMIVYIHLLCMAFRLDIKSNLLSYLIVLHNTPNFKQCSLYLGLNFLIVWLQGSSLDLDICSTYTTCTWWFVATFFAWKTNIIVLKWAYLLSMSFQLVCPLRRM